MERPVLDIIVRDNPTKPEKKRLRNEGYLVACISSTREKSLHIALNARLFKMALKSMDESKEFILVTNGKEEYLVRFKELQMHVGELDIAHVDFQLISHKKENELEIAI